jgi:hypothetical protein
MSEPLMSSDAETRKRQIGALLFLTMVPVMAYFFMYRPIAEGLRTGSLHYYLKGVVLPPLVLYLSVVMLFTKLKDGQVKVRDAAGKIRYTRQGKLFLAGVVAVIVVTMAGWYALLHALGFTGLF